MKYQLAAILLAAAAGWGCGDNGAECGTGTMLDDSGHCVPTTTPPMCANGTVLDAASNSCVIDPASCQGGTVLIGTTCQDPTAGLMIDVEEAAEPNALGILGVEDSNDVAGDITLKPIGETVVVHGHMTPFQDENTDGQKDPDYDTYVLEVTGPTLLNVSVDGVNGVMGAFVAVNGSNNALADANPNWIRYGMNVTGDTSKRQLFLPTAGTYGIVIADVRSIYIDGDSPPAAGFGGAAGSATAQYYMSIEQIAIPSPTSIALTSGVGTVDDTLSPDSLKFYTTTMGLGFNDVLLEVPGTAGGGVVLMRNNAIKAAGDETAGSIFSGPADAEAFALGFKTGDTSLIVADYTYNYGPDPEPFTLTVTAGDATALSTTGGTSTQTEISDVPSSLFDFNVFYYDVGATDEVDAFNLHWSVPVDGSVVTEDLAIFANFTSDLANTGPTGETFTDYRGLMRHPTAGRYYFIVYDPAGTPGTDDIVATSTIVRHTVVPVVKGTVLAGQTMDTVAQSNAFSYAANVAADGWQQFDAVGTATGNNTLRFFNPTNTYGRLDDVPSATSAVPDVAPIFSTTIPEAGAPVGRILLDDGTSDYFVTVNTATVSGTPTFDLDFRRRAHTDLGTVAAAANVTRMDEPLSDTVTVQRYLVRTTAGNALSIAVSPDSTFDTAFQLRNTTEGQIAAFNNGAAGADDTATFLQSGNGWTAFTVVATPTLTTAETFDLTVGAATAPNVTYTSAASATAFVDACTGTGGGVLSLADDGSGYGGDDEGLSAPIAAPAGFDFYGLTPLGITVSSNGWLTFGSATSAAFNYQDLPSATTPNAVVAPFWTDLFNVQVCTKTSGSTLIVQWTGDDGFDTVEFQAIFDGADDTIEFVYGNDQVADGSFASVGVENGTGTVATDLGFETTSVAPDTSVKLTP